MEQAVSALVGFVEMFRINGPRPILWVGAGASAAAGYPTLWQLEELLRKHLSDCTESGFALIDAFVSELGLTTLANELETHLGKPRPFVGLHEAIARLAKGGAFHAIFTTNYDELIEDALKAQHTHFVPQVQELNYELQERNDVLLLKLHGSRTNWQSVILSGESYKAFKDSYPLLKNQLDQSLRTCPLLFVGCSMRDPRLLEWLDALSDIERKRLYPGRVLITRNDWAKLTDKERALLASANIKPILVDSHPDIAAVLAQAAQKLAPLDPQELTFELTPGKDRWRVVGPTRESTAHEVSNPLADKELVDKLAALRKEACKAVRVGTPEAAAQEAVVGSLARGIGARLSEVLLSSEARAQVVRRSHDAQRGRARLSIRVAGASEESDRALALPWELLMPEPGEFPVQRNTLDVVYRAAEGGDRVAHARRVHRRSRGSEHHAPLRGRSLPPLSLAGAAGPPRGVR